MKKGGRRLLVGTSYGGGTPAASNVIRSSDFVLLHGNGADDRNGIRKMVQATRAAEGYRAMPVLINEDDHFRFDAAGQSHDGGTWTITCPGAISIRVRATTRMDITPKARSRMAICLPLAAAGVSAAGRGGRGAFGRIPTRGRSGTSHGRVQV